MKKTLKPTILALSLFVLGGVFSSPASACSKHDHLCTYHALGTPTTGYDVKDQTTRLVIYAKATDTSHGDTKTDFDNHVLLPTTHDWIGAPTTESTGPFINSRTSFGQANPSDVGEWETPQTKGAHVYGSQYQVIFNKNTAQAIHTGDLNGGEKGNTPYQSGCPAYEGKANCEAVVITGNVPSGTYQQHVQMFNFHNVDNPKAEIEIGAWATGQGVLISDTHLDSTSSNFIEANRRRSELINQGTSEIHGYTLLEGHKSKTPEPINYHFYNRGFDAHAQGVTSWDHSRYHNLGWSKPYAITNEKTIDTYRNHLYRIDTTTTTIGALGEQYDQKRYGKVRIDGTQFLGSQANPEYVVRQQVEHFRRLGSQTIESIDRNVTYYRDKIWGWINPVDYKLINADIDLYARYDNRRMVCEPAYRAPNVVISDIRDSATDIMLIKEVKQEGFKDFLSLEERSQYMNQSEKDIKSAKSHNNNAIIVNSISGSMPFSSCFALEGIVECGLEFSPQTKVAKRATQIKKANDKINKVNADADDTAKNLNDLKEKYNKDGTSNISIISNNQTKTTIETNINNKNPTHPTTSTPYDKGSDVGSYNDSKIIPKGYTKQSDGNIVGPRGAPYTKTKELDASGNPIFKDSNGKYYTFNDGEKSATPSPYEKSKIQEFKEIHDKRKDEVKQFLEKQDQNFKISEKEITFKTQDGTRARADIVAEDRDGNLYIFEVKTGNATLSTGQEKVYGNITEGAVYPVGNVAKDFGLDINSSLAEKLKDKNIYFTIIRDDDDLNEVLNKAKETEKNIRKDANTTPSSESPKNRRGRS